MLGAHGRFFLLQMKCFSLPHAVHPECFAKQNVTRDGNQINGFKRDFYLMYPDFHLFCTYFFGRARKKPVSHPGSLFHIETIQLELIEIGRDVLKFI